VILLVFVLLTVIAAAGAHAASQYYVQAPFGRPQQMQGDPDQTSYDNWEIWLYQAGLPADGGSFGRWGTISGKSAASVERQLEAGQAFEKHWVKWCHCGDTGSTTFFNPLGPIAILPHQTLFPNHALAQLDASHKLFDKVYGLIKRINSAAQMADEEAILPKGPFMDFMNRTHDAIDRAAQLGSALSNANGEALFGISGQLASLDQKFDALTAQSDDALASLRSVKRPSSDEKPIAPTGGYIAASRRSDDAGYVNNDFFAVKDGLLYIRQDLIQGGAPYQQFWVVAHARAASFRVTNSSTFTRVSIFCGKQFGNCVRLTSNKDGRQEASSTHAASIDFDSDADAAAFVARFTH
jgi:hypothetical protein